MLEAVAEDLWTVRGELVVFAGLAFPTQMVVVRLPDGGLWLNSPVRRTAEIAAEISALGPVREIVCPNSFHHLFVGEWVDDCPDARVYAAPGLRKKRPDLHFEADLVDELPDAWAAVIDQRCFRGNRVMEEFVFLHRATRTLMITDLLINLRADDFPAPARWFATLDGVRAPNGGTPRLYRWTQRSREAARECVDWMIGSRPERILFPHGEAFDGDPEDVLREKFAWVLRR